MSVRVLPDTNVLISGLWWPGPSRRIWEAVREGVIRAVTSPALLHELCNVLTRPTGPFKISAREVRPIARQIRLHCVLVVPHITSVGIRVLIREDPWMVCTPSKIRSHITLRGDGPEDRVAPPWPSLEP